MTNVEKTKEKLEGLWLQWESMNKYASYKKRTRFAEQLLSRCEKIKVRPEIFAEYGKFIAERFPVGEQKSFMDKLIDTAPYLFSFFIGKGLKNGTSEYGFDLSLLESDLIDFKSRYFYEEKISLCGMFSINDWKRKMTTRDVKLHIAHGSNVTEKNSNGNNVLYYLVDRTPDIIPFVIKDILKKCEMEKVDPYEFLNTEIPYFQKKPFLFKLVEKDNLRLFIETIFALHKSGIKMKPLFETKVTQNYDLFDRFYINNISNTETDDTFRKTFQKILLLFIDSDMTITIDGRRPLQKLLTEILNNFVEKFEKMKNFTNRNVGEKSDFDFDYISLLALGMKCSALLSSCTDKTEESIETIKKWNDRAVVERMKNNVLFDSIAKHTKKETESTDCFSR